MEREKVGMGVMGIGNPRKPGGNIRDTGYLSGKNKERGVRDDGKR